MDKLDLMLNQINQYHNIIRDFSNQSTAIKKLSITIYITFLSIYFGFNGNSPVMPKVAFWIIGIMIPLFSYAYEIYIDKTRQQLRELMYSLMIDYEKSVKEPTDSSIDKSPILSKYMIFRCIYNKQTKKIEFLGNTSKYKDNRKKYYFIDLTHLMYLIYAFEIIITLVIGFVVVKQIVG